MGGTTPCFSISAATSGEGEAIDAFIASISATSAVTAIWLLPSSATKSVTLEPDHDSMAAARSAFPLSQRSTSTMAWVATIFGVEQLLFRWTGRGDPTYSPRAIPERGRSGVEPRGERV